MAPRQLTALLAMPAPLRPLVLAAAAAAAASPARSRAALFSTGRRLHAGRGLKGPLTVGAFTAPRLPTRPWAAVPVERLLESPGDDPDASLADELSALFTHTPATFYHGTSDFYALKKNTQVPEICILGRSNAGKSTFVNALANRRGNALARVSSKAGHTKAMNLYGFGPAPHPADLLAADADAKRTEDMPKHRLYVVDMPGYGHKSLRDWGRHIDLYLQKRAAARGAVLLVDAEVGPKPNDFQALDMLCAHDVRTAVVLTKADKARHEDVLRDTCQRVLLYVRDLADRRHPDSPWRWEPDFFVTAVGATRKETGLHSVDVARLAVARLAGLIQEKERAEPDETPSWSGKVVSFDQLEAQYAPPPPAPTTTPASSGRGPPPSPVSVGDDDSANWTPLERAARAQYQAQTTATTTTTTPAPPRLPSSSGPPPSRPSRPRHRPQNRAFHTQSEHRRKDDDGWIDFESRSESPFESKAERRQDERTDEKKHESKGGIRDGRWGGISTKREVLIECETPYKMDELIERDIPPVSDALFERKPPHKIARPDQQERKDGEQQGKKGAKQRKRKGEIVIKSDVLIECETPDKSDKMMEYKTPPNIARPDHRELTKVLKTFIENLRKDLPPAPQPRILPGSIGDEPVSEEARLAEQKRLDRLRRRQEAIFKPLRESLQQYDDGALFDAPPPPPKPANQYGDGPLFDTPPPPKPLNRYRHGEIFDPLHKPRWWPKPVYQARMVSRNTERHRNRAIAEQRRATELAAESRRQRRAIEKAERLAEEEAAKKRGGRRAAAKPRRLPGDDLREDDVEASRWADSNDDDDEAGLRDDEEEDDMDDEEDDDDDAAPSLSAFHRTITDRKAAVEQKRMERGYLRHGKRSRPSPRQRATAAAPLDGHNAADGFEAKFKNRR